MRDQLCLLIRQYNLDPTLVKAYAADFCGTQSLKEASRERVESFISHLAACAKESRDALVCRCLIDWKTTTSHYSETPEGLLSLDPRLIGYSWISGIPEAALVVFVRKHAPEVQYLRASLSEEQRQEFGRLIETTVAQIEAGHFNSHSGIRFPQNGCLSCPHLGLCLHNDHLVAANLVRRAGASNLDWLDELVD